MEILEISPKRKHIKRLRVAAYARVSSSKNDQLHSLKVQVDYYYQYISSNPNYIFSGVYADEGISGTKNNRPEFNNLIDKCHSGEIDVVITKSISRFARNTATLLKTIRELKEINVDVYFEEQNIHTLSKEGELVLTLLASVAEEEARSMSENVKWKVRKCFEAGRLYSMTILGYRLINGKLKVVPSEANIVKKIFELYLSGYGRKKIYEEMIRLNYKSRYGKEISFASIPLILRNEVYTGDLILQKTFRPVISSRKNLPNIGQRRKWIIEDDHVPIISKTDFNKVQEMMSSKGYKKEAINEDPFRRLLKCSVCGHHYVRKKNAKRHYYTCTTFSIYGKDKCSSKCVPEDELIRLTKEVISNDDISSLRSLVKEIEVLPNNTLLFHFNNGKEETRIWNDHSRKESWNEVNRAKQREIYLRRLEKKSNEQD